VKVLVTGAGGQVASALEKLKPAQAELTVLSQQQLDITDREAVIRAVEAQRPALLINAAAYTAVDKAENERDLAFQVNGMAPGWLAQAARDQGARCFHISTDFVFDGRAGAPYRPDAEPAPLGAYGESKLQGERTTLAADPRALVLRTAWVYAAQGHNFVRTMLRLMAERGSVRVVADQQGSPTWASSIAAVLWKAAEAPDFHGLHHWTDAGVVSWYDFAVAIAEEGQAIGLLKNKPEVQAIGTADYPTPARRPAYSVLDRSSTEAALHMHAAPWRDNLKKMLKELKDA
jgi:dTDP-4-dehydrorhamnose reductase